MVLAQVCASAREALPVLGNADAAQQRRTHIDRTPWKTDDPDGSFSVWDARKIVLNGDLAAHAAPDLDSSETNALRQNIKHLEQMIQAARARLPPKAKRFYFVTHSGFTRASRWAPRLRKDEKERLHPEPPGVATHRVVTFGIAGVTAEEAKGRLNDEFFYEVPEAFGYGFRGEDARVIPLGAGAPGGAVGDGRTVETAMKALLKLAKKQHAVGTRAREALNRLGVAPFDHPACAVAGAAPDGIVDETMLLSDATWHAA